jgi:alanine racemase
MRATRLDIDTQALQHNLAVIKKLVLPSNIIAMVKSNAYGCGMALIAKTLSGQVETFGVACVDEALWLRHLGIDDPCLIFEGLHQQQEIESVANYGFELVLHQWNQIQWITNTPTQSPLKVWIKINTGMNRLGFQPNELIKLVTTLKSCPWIDEKIGLMTHFACADDPVHPLHHQQIQEWQRLVKDWQGPVSACNSAAIWTTQQFLGTCVRPGLSLYGVSPLPDSIGMDLNLKPVMRLYSSILTIHEVGAGEFIGYSATYQTLKHSKIAIVPIGYGDGYPRHIQTGTCVSINGQLAPIVGRISMDKMTVDVTNYPSVQIGDPVELWGENLPIEYVAKQSGTIPYELMCQVGPRERLFDLFLK